MKKVIIHIPTTKKEIKEFILDNIKWFIHPKRMKNNKKILDEIAYEICNEIKSNYWSHDISEEMKDRLTNRFRGTIYDIIYDKKRKLI